MTDPIYALVLDDNPMNGDVLGLLLERQGVQVVVLTQAQQLATALADMPSVHVVFLDLELPNTTGFDLLGGLKNNPKLQNCPIVAYSVHISEIDVVRRAGFDSFLGKPLNMQRFPNQLRRILNRESVWEV